MFREMWKTVEAKAGKVRMAEAKEEREKGRRRKATREGEKERRE